MCQDKNGTKIALNSYHGPRMRPVFERVILGVLVLILAASATREFQRSPHYADIPSYRRVDWWVLSARCAQVEHVDLVTCGPHGELYPIEDVSPTDDRGHVLLLDLAAMITSSPPSRTDSVRMNLLINLVGVVLLAGFLWVVGMRGTALLTLAAGTWLFPVSVKFAGPDAPATFLGEFALAALPVVWLGRSNGKWTLTLKEGGLCLVSVLSLVAAILLRQAIGLAGVAATMALLVMGWIKSRASTWRTAAPYVILLAAMALTTQSTNVLLALRNRWVPLPPAHLIATHGVAHSLYQGLGTEPNPWGIVYEDDNDSRSVIEKISPAATYGTPLYYREIGKVYLTIVFTHPLTVLGIYARKLWKTLALPLKVFGIPYGWYIILIGVAIAREWRRHGLSSLPLRTAAALALYLAIFLSQGVLISPEIRFLYPAKFAALVLLSLLLEHRLTARPQ
jgi:hypothetical protein